MDADQQPQPDANTISDPDRHWDKYGHADLDAHGYSIRDVDGDGNRYGNSDAVGFVHSNSHRQSDRDDY